MILFNMFLLWLLSLRGCLLILYGGQLLFLSLLLGSFVVGECRLLDGNDDDE